MAIYKLEDRKKAKVTRTTSAESGLQESAASKAALDVAKGVPLPWLLPGAKLSDEARNALGSATYVGIDFGTSTSVVSVVEVNEESGALGATPISIRQFDRLGKEIDGDLIPTCIAWVDGRLLVGTGAAELKTELTEGKDLWTSFKMLLGVDLGASVSEHQASKEPRFNDNRAPRGCRARILQRAQGGYRGLRQPRGKARAHPIHRDGPGVVRGQPTQRSSAVDQRLWHFRGRLCPVR